MADGFAALGERSVIEHIDGIERQVRARPQDAGLRLALCHFLALRGEWQRADDQLKAAVKLDPAFAGASATCAMALRGERAREEFWAGGPAPAVIGDAAPWIDDLLAAAALPGDRAAEAAVLRESAREEAPALSGHLASLARADMRIDDTHDGEPVQRDAFDWLCDGDARLGAVFEVFSNTGYGWLAMPAVRRLKLRRPQHLVDLLWAPAQVELHDGRGVAVLLPVRYPGALAALDDALALARRTDWQALSGDDQYAGVGQRTLISGEGDHPLLDLRLIEFDAAA